MSRAEEKATLRAQALRARQESGGNQAGISQNLTKALRPYAGRVLAGYWPMRGEADPRPVMQAYDCPVCLPVVTGKAVPLIFRRWQGEALESGPFGTSHPSESSPELCPSLLIVPLAAFDRAGNRIGYGGGYYDRTLEFLRKSHETLAIGLAFASQELPDIPTEPFDQPLDMVVTCCEVILPETTQL